MSAGDLERIMGVRIVRIPYLDNKFSVSETVELADGSLSGLLLKLI